MKSIEPGHGCQKVAQVWLKPTHRFYEYTEQIAASIFLVYYTAWYDGYQSSLEELYL
jgi:hypothetical protein